MAGILPYLLVGGSAAVAARSQRDVEKRQQRLVEAMQQYQTGKAKQSEASIDTFLKTLTPEARAAQNKDVKSELAKGLEESVATTQAYEKPSNFSGKVSDAYTGRVASNEAATAERLKRAMEQLAVIGSPAESNFKRQVAFGRSAGDVDSANTAIRNVGSAYEGEIGRVRPKAWEDFVSQLMLGGGLGLAGGTPAPRPRPRTGLYDFGPNIP